MNDFTHGTGFAVTPIQAGMVYEISAQGDGAVNLEQVVIHLEAVVDAGRMAQAWSAAIAHHPAMRLAVGQDAAGRVRQTVMPAFAAPLVTQDFGLTGLADWLAQDRARGVDLTRGDGWRLTLLQGSGRNVLVWTFSHVCLDGRSFQAVLKDVFADYDGLGTGFAVRPAFGPMCDALAQVDPAPARAMFARYLAGLDTPTRIGFVDHAPENATKATGNRTLRAALTETQSAALMQRAADVGASFATMVQAAWGIVLSRVSGQGDVMFGVTRSGRYLTPEARDMVGCLITTQPLRMAIGPATRLNDVLRAVRADLLAQRPHEGLGLSDIAAVCDIPNGTPLFDSLVMVERQSLNAAMRAQGGAWAKRRVELFEQGAMPLTLAAYNDAALQLQLEYMPSRIAAQEAQRYLDYTTRLLGAMAVADDDAVLADLDMLGPDEAADLLRLGQPIMPVPQPRPACAATAFEAVAANQPSAAALAIAGETDGFDFATLDARANQLAHCLAQSGIGQGAIIGLCLPRSAEFVALLLAASKVGAAFLPMDPAYPPESLLHMAQDSGLAMIFTKAPAAWMADFPVTLMSDGLGRDAPVHVPTRDGMAADRMAYVIYTSGTTGRPKGVAVSQRGLVAHALAAIAAYDLTPKDRVLQFGALSFDVAIEEIVPTLLAGATLILRDDAMMASPQAFVDRVASEGITVLNLPTGFWQVLLAALEAGTATLPQAVRLMIVGGERMPPNALARWQALPDMPRLMNAYGPTEATITCAMFEPNGPVVGPQVPVGRSFGHALTYLRAPDGSLAPMGARAALWVGGDAVAMGYLSQPDLTAQRFVPDPFVKSDPQARVYCSGDMAHWNEDGQAVVAGRSDRQIKLRGFRIEPAEVEAVLEAIPGVAEAHVGVSDQRLIGWLRPSDAGAVPDAVGVAGYVATQLPPSKCPEVVFVTDWPQTPGGKTDVRRLAAPVRGVQALADAEVFDPQAARIAQVFAEVLGIEVPAISASFFDLGGHSLQLLTLIGQIEAAFDTRLSVAQVHAAPTPQGLAALLGASGETGPNLFDCLMPIQPLGTGIPIYGVHVLGVNGSFFRPLAKAMGLDQPIFGLTVGLLSANTPTSVVETAALYFRTIQLHRPTGPVGLVAVSLGSYMALELAQQLRAAGREVRLLAMMDAAGPAGRDKIRGMAWVCAHLRLIRGGGMPYARNLIAGKLDSLRHRLEKLRLAVEERVLRDTRVLTSVDGFVAANAVAIENYDPQPYAGRMMIFRAKDSLFDSDAAVANGLGWHDVAQGGFEVVDVSGNHLSILEAPGVLDVAAVLAAAIGRTEQA
ncbi:non-ribosomal peptide synthetase [Pseudorhodobacter ferrugineus]|uniref:non-ribosomal peptide synthetase n=1 Tax=Pseudorhodobacter ferrugineus TaxID=77008 RepID=UPI000404C644|nr:non-ribosomal peptide synthetase [Pseudorhodobacter ferrugineus]